MAKVKKVRSGQFTMIGNLIFDDYRLSYKEIGIYCNMMKFPDDWDFSIRYLADCHTDKRDSVRSGIEKLIELGYISRKEKQSRGEKGLFGKYDYLLYEDPRDNPLYIPCPARNFSGLKDEDRCTENPTTDETPCTENPTADEEFCMVNPATKNKPCTENPTTDEEICVVNPAMDEEPCTENPMTDERCTGFPCTDNPTIHNTVLNKTISNNTFLTKNEEEEDIAHAHVNMNSFQRKLMNKYMCNYLANLHYPVAQREMRQSFNAICNAIDDITDPVAIDAINECSKEEAEKLWEKVYNDMFSTELGTIIRSDIRDRHSYLVKYVADYFKTGFGPDPLSNSFGVYTRK